MYDKNLKLVDCTIRDGGLINKWQFPVETVRAVFQAINASGVDYMELGYRASRNLFSPKEFGLWRFTEDSVVRDMIGDTPVRTKLGAMVDIGRVEPDDIAPKSESPLDFFRVATYVKDIDKAIWLANHIEEKGYETYINIMAISTVSNFDLVDALRQATVESRVKAITVVDSYGALSPKRARELVRFFISILGDKISVGFHAHNNLQLGFANTIEALEEGAHFCDATVYGIGRAAGNCPLELLLGFLKNPRYDIEPVLKAIQEVSLKLREQIEWGYIIPYMITGMLNEHPRVAMALRDSDQKDNYAGFYKEMTTPECLNKS